MPLEPVSSRWQIAQINVARALTPLDSPQLAEFVSELDRVNALADSAPGFVWRLQDASGSALDLRVAGDPLLIVNMSLWASIEALEDFTYRSAHARLIGRRRDWFEAPQGSPVALWWVPAGERPSLSEGLTRLEELRARGPSSRAFGFKSRYTPATD